MSDARLKVMQDAYWDWSEMPGGSSVAVDKMLRVLLDAFDAHATPSASPAEGKRKIVQIAACGFGDDKHVVALASDGSMWERRLYGPTPWSRFPSVAEIEGAVETEAG